MQLKTSYLPLLAVILIFFLHSVAALDVSALGVSTIEEFVSSGGPIQGAVDDLELFWERARHYSEQVIENAVDGSKDVSEKMVEIKEHIAMLVQDGTTLHDELHATIKRANDSDDNAESSESDDDTRSERVMNDIRAALEQAFAAVVEELKVMFPPPDQAPGHEERQRMVAVALEKAGTAFMTVIGSYGMEKEHLQVHWDAMRPSIEAMVVLLGDLVEQHPYLFTALVVVVVVEIAPTNWILRPFLNLFGFGPIGPVKGTPASWAQRIFYGATVGKGSWFAFLQRVAMT
ncbi:hypothetical protein C8R43DRAFT_1075153 [Mycena crocata]|nr:hypothetical protein C8R43DRAFT_1075153 [Mycena crocata]